MVDHERINWGVVSGIKLSCRISGVRQRSYHQHLNIFSLFAQPGMSAGNGFAVRGFTESRCARMDMADYGISASCVHLAESDNIIKPHERQP
jgi:hypothetical protein